MGTAFIGFKSSQQERKILEDEARAAGLSISEFIRSKLFRNRKPGTSVRRYRRKKIA